MQKSFNNAFSLRIHGDNHNHPFEHIRSDSTHITKIARLLSLNGLKVSVSAFARNWVTFEDGFITGKTYAWKDHYLSDSDSRDSEREIGIMFQTLAFEAGN